MDLQPVAFLVLLPALHAIVSLNVRETQWARNSSSDNLVFGDHLLWNRRSRSQLDCAKLCTEDSSCKTFTFTRLRSESTDCRGHSQTVMSGGTKVPGTTYFNSAVDRAPRHYLGSSWLQKPCTSHSECSVDLSECFMSRCLCTPGYYYSIGTDSCLASCSDLQTDFVRYPQWFLSLSNTNDSVLPWADCQAWCVSLPGCVSLEYSYGDSKCYIATVTVLDVPQHWKPAKSNLSYWQRTCA